MIWSDIRLQQESLLSSLAAKSSNSLGRKFYEPPCKIRLDFERDANRILYSDEFRRLRHKTQVFFNAKNDHICTRMEHVLYVNSISNTIAKTLNLNQELTSAIALGHDLGHAPYGHSGERALNRCLRKVNPTMSFRHEYHSLRVVDILATRISKEKIAETCGLNLTYEVRDGIVSHCGENYDEYILHKDESKMPCDIYITNHREHMPYTLEACVVRLVDKIAYVGRDIEDAVRAKLININDISKDVINELGVTNGEVINTLVLDLLENSYGTDSIQLSKEKGEALRDMINENNRLIYQSDMIKTYEKNSDNILEGLFNYLYNACKDRENLINSSNRVLNNMGLFIIDKHYFEDEKPEQIVIDYIAGMTDGYALKCYEELYWI